MLFEANFSEFWHFTAGVEGYKSIFEVIVIVHQEVEEHPGHDFFGVYNLLATILSLHELAKQVQTPGDDFLFLCLRWL